VTLIFFCILFQKQDKYKDEPPTAIDLFEAFHCSRKTGCSVPVKEAIVSIGFVVDMLYQDFGFKVIHKK